MRLAPQRWPNGDEKHNDLSPFDLWPQEVEYAELRERADDRLRVANSPAQVLKALKLLVYVQNRAYRELGAIV